MLERQALALISTSLNEAENHLNEHSFPFSLYGESHRLIPLGLDSDKEKGQQQVREHSVSLTEVKTRPPVLNQSTTTFKSHPFPTIPTSRTPVPRNVS